jgi:hypothetical protein
MGDLGCVMAYVTIVKIRENKRSRKECRFVSEVKREETLIKI